MDRHYIKHMLALSRVTLITISALLALSFSLSLPAIETQVNVPSAEHQRATQLITEFLGRYHYRKVRLDDQFSAQVFDRFIETLDPGKTYFLASDIEELSYYRFGIDDSLKNAKVDSAFAIFGRYQKRIEERTEYALSQLNRDFDFTVDEDFIIDRQKAEWPKTINEQNEIWRKRVKNDVLTLKLANKDPQDIKETLSKRYNNALKRSQQLNADDIYQLYINAYTTSIDPHTNYLSPRTYDDFEIRMSLSLEGIGALLRTDGDYTVVERIIPGGPADLSDLLHAKDKIVGIAQEKDRNFTDVIGWRLEEVVQLIRGPKGTHVRLQILPAKVGEGAAAQDIVIERNKIKLEEQAAKSNVIEIATSGGKKKVGIITIPTFYMDFSAYQRGDKDYRSTTRDVAQLLKGLNQKGIDSLVLDLRSNGGGSLIEATQLAGLFITKGPIVQVRDSSGHIDVQHDEDANIAYQGPMIVLVDRYSASASEIVTSALQDYKRAVIVGEPTFGKGSVQQLIDLDRIDDNPSAKLGQLKATIAQYFRINGEATQFRGVIPDIMLETYVEDDKQGERSLDNALPWSQITPVKFTQGKLSKNVLGSLQSRHNLRVGENPSYAALIKLYQLNNEIQTQDRVSLFEEKRKQRFDNIEKQRKDYEKLAGVAPLNDDTDDMDTETAQPNDQDAPDILLEETAQIAADLSQFWGTPIIAERDNP